MSKILQRLRQKPSPPDPPPCPVCHNLVFTTSDLKISIADLRTSALNPSPCPCCALLWHLISEITSPDTVHADITYDHLLFTLPSYLARHGTGPLSGHLVPSPLLGGTPPPSQDLQFYTHPSSPPSPYPSIGIAPPIPTSALTSLPLLRTWLTLCTTSTARHTPCPPPSPSHPLPTRLIDVRTTPPRLYLPTPTPTTPSYAALSHCWANRPTLVTLTTTLPSHLVSLPPRLPQTFADAITVTQHLGIPFLWIDSLCILQDSPADWAREASRMGDVYANALVTISADAASGPDAGFLAPPARCVGTEVGGAAGEAVVYVRKRGKLAEELPFHSLDGEGGRSLLATRGWVFQERLLAPRTVHFSRGETAWECRALCDCECSVASPRTVRTVSVVKRFLVGGEGEGEGGAGGMWRREVVPAYTRLELTVVTDRLPALEGLARAMAGVRGGGYLWGLWRETLGRDLLWRTEGGGKKGEFLPEGYAPTWSWGSVVGQVMYDEEEEEGKGVGIEVVGVDDDGVLKGRACAVDVKLKWARRDVVVPADADNSPPFERRRPRPGQTPVVELGVVWDCRKEGGADSSVVYTFLVLGSRSGKRGPFGLLLRPVGERGEGKRFRRVGFIGGYKRSIEPRLRRWGSGGWETDPANDVLAFVTGYRDGGSSGGSGSEDDLDRWDGWTETVLSSPWVAVEVV